MKRYDRKTGAVYCFGECDIDETDVRATLGEPHAIEDDPTRTHSGTEMYWVFETGHDQALAFSFHQIIGRLFIATNGDSAAAAEEVEKNFGIAYVASHGRLWD